MKDQEEIWKYVPQYDGFLQASNHGNIREFVQILKADGLPHVWNKRSIQIRRGTQGGNYISYDGREQSASRIIFSAFFYIPHTSHRIMHKDGDSLNTRPDNLYCESSNAKGESNYQAKLKNKQIYLLCLDFINGYTGKGLAEKYNIHYMTVYRILQNNIWKSVERPKITRDILKNDREKIKEFITKKIEA